MFNHPGLSLVVLCVCVSVGHAIFQWGGNVCPKEDQIGSAAGATQYFR